MVIRVRAEQALQQSASGLRVVTSETAIVTTKQTPHAIKARHMMEPSELPNEKMNLFLLLC